MPDFSRLNLVVFVARTHGKKGNRSSGECKQRAALVRAYRAMKQLRETCQRQLSCQALPSVLLFISGSEFEIVLGISFTIVHFIFRCKIYSGTDCGFGSQRNLCSYLKYVKFNDLIKIACKKKNAW